MTDDELRILHADRDALLDALTAAGATVKGPTRIVCPFHDDRNPSGTTYQGDDGAWRFKCMGCGVCEDTIGVQALAGNRSAADVLTATGTDRRPSGSRPPARPAKPAKPAPPPRVFPDLDSLRRAVSHVSAVHRYTHPTTGAVELVVIRAEPPGEKKRFVQASPAPDVPGFVMKAPAGPMPIYNRTRLAAAGTIIVVEGEKCVEVLARLGYTATTSPGGADNGHKADWSPLTGKTDVILWPDHDAPDADGIRKGHRHMAAVAELLGRLDPPPTLRWVDPEPYDLPAGGDAVDFVEQHGGDDDVDRRRAVDCILDMAEPFGGAAELGRVLEDQIAGRLRVVPLPWKITDALSQALMPGTVTCLAGEPGSSKSFAVIQSMLFWQPQGVKAAAYLLEDDKPYHLLRALAQLAGVADVTDARWVRANPADARAAYALHKPVLDRLAASLTVAPDVPVSLAEVAAWVAERARAGAEVIVVDPVTAAAVGDKRHLEDLEFITKVKAVARRHKCRVILTTHPKAGGKSWSDLAGGTAFPRFSHTVFWLRTHAPGRRLLVERRSAGQTVRDAVDANRTIRLGKTRNGRGAGLEVAFTFDPATLRFDEQGVVVKADNVDQPDPADPSPF